MKNINRIGITKRWSDIVIYQGIARFVEVADDPNGDFEFQVRQILNQIDQKLVNIGSNRGSVLQVMIYVSDFANLEVLNQHWDSWFPEDTAPVRACVQVGLQQNYLIEMVIEAAVGDLGS